MKTAELLLLLTAVFFHEKRLQLAKERIDKKKHKLDEAVLHVRGKHTRRTDKRCALRRLQLEDIVALQQVVI